MFFDHGWNVQDFLDFSKSQGVTYVELLNLFWRDQEREIAELEQTLGRDLICASYAVSNDFANPDPEAFAQSQHEVIAGIYTAKRLGATVVRVFAGNARPERPWQESFNQIVAGMKTVSAVAEREDVTLCLENHGHLAGRSDQVKAIIDAVQSPRLRAAFDVGNFILVDQDPLEAERDLLGYFKHVHLKDIEPCEGEDCWQSVSGRKYRGAPLGRGLVPLKEALQLLRDHEYDGYLTLEFEGPGDERIGIEHSLQTLHKLLA